MNNLKFLFFVPFLFCCEQNLEFKILTYNVKEPISTKGTIDSWENREFYIQRFLNRNKPDIATFQEVKTKQQIKTLTEAFNEDEFDFYWNQKTGLATFYKIESPASQTFPLSGNKRAYVKTHFKNFTFCGLHAGVYGGDEFYELMQETAITLSKSNCDVLAGDFNHLPYKEEEWPNIKDTYPWIELGKSPMYSILTQDYIDIWDALNPNIIEDTAPGFVGNYRDKIDARIDWVLLKRNSLLNPKNIKIFDPKRPNGRRLSDHRPILFILETK